MIFFPAIDLKDGQCVRLEKGDMDKATIFDSDPVSRAKSFLKSGCSWLAFSRLKRSFSRKTRKSKGRRKYNKKCRYKYTTWWRY